MEDNGLFIWPGDTRIQGTSNYGINIVIPGYSGSSTRSVNEKMFYS